MTDKTAKPYNYRNLKAVFINCPLKPSPQQSQTGGLMEVALTICRAA